MGGDMKKHLKGGGTVINETVGRIGEPGLSRRCTATLQLGISGMAEVGRPGGALGSGTSRAGGRLEVALGWHDYMSHSCPACDVLSKFQVAKITK